ncbi:MAG TPA: AMP nucleosidase [Saprospiraceae bacterium]|nr:AMP nucleosidase [Saprospiraceae bacterium]
MLTKEDIVTNWLPRYTGMPLDMFRQYILLTNFYNYMELFCSKTGAQLYGKGKMMQAASTDNITLINFGMGSPNAATIMDMLSIVKPEACLFLGKCGGLRPDKNKVGDLILPIAAIRGEGTSDDYMAPEVPALPAFALQKATSTTIREFNKDYWTGTVYTTNRRVWEHDDEFKDYLRELRTMAIDMETATIFTTAFFNHIPAGALLLVSDLPMIPEGIKTEESDRSVTKNFASLHLDIGIASLRQLINNSLTVKHLKF